MRTTEPRRITMEDLHACADVFYAAQDELYTRLGQPLLPRNEIGLVSFFQHLLATDPGGAWLLEASGEPPRVVAFAIANQRDDAWFLSFLFVHPEFQGAGCGRRLLERTLPERWADDEGPRTIPDNIRHARRLGTCVESLQPISTGLYASYGLIPRVPIFSMVGDADPNALPRLHESLVVEPFNEIVERAGHEALLLLIDSLDRATLGYTRRADHAAWRAGERRGVAYRDAASGMVRGYGYVHGSGRVGPVTLLDGALLPGVLGHLFGRLQPAGAWQVLVPGVAAHALVALLRGGLRFDGPPALYCGNWSGPAFERYLPASFGLL